MDGLVRGHDDGDPERWDDAVGGTLTFRALFGRTLTATSDLTAGVAEFAPGEHLAAHWHHAAEIYLVTAGHGTVRLGEDLLDVRAGSTVFVPGGRVHGVRNTGVTPLSVFYVLAADDVADVAYHFTGDDHGPG